MSEKTFMETSSWSVSLHQLSVDETANIAIVGWYYYVSWYLGSYAEGNHGACAIVNEGQDHRTTRAQILRLDWWFHLGVSFHLPADVDLKAGVRREWTVHCPPQMLLRFVVFKAQHTKLTGIAFCIMS